MPSESRGRAVTEEARGPIDLLASRDFWPGQGPRPPTRKRSDTELLGAWANRLRGLGGGGDHAFVICGDRNIEGGRPK